MLWQIYKLLASLKLAVVLIVVLAIVLSVATIVEAEQGREYSQWYVYGSYWFSGLLALLGINILAATLIRFPWKKRQIGFVVTHAGLLVLLFGSIQTFLGGVEGQVALLEGESADEILLTDRSVIGVQQSAPEERRQTSFSFRPGPVDWPAGKELHFGEEDGLGLKILGYCRHGRTKTDWVADDTKGGPPALRLILSGKTGQPVDDGWLEPNTSGSELVLGTTKYDLYPVPVQTMAQDFLEPRSADELGECGVLSLHYRGERLEVAIDEHLGKQVTLGDGAAKVEIVTYWANAKRRQEGGFASVGDKPKNPVLELKVHLLGENEIMRKLVFARKPLLSLDAVHGRECPVKFWYHHPALVRAPGAQFLQTPDGKLVCRAVVGGSAQPPREVQPGDRIPLGTDFAVYLSKHLPHARQEVTFLPAKKAGANDDGPEAAALFEVSLSGKKHQMWLRRNDPQYGQQWIASADGPVKINFGSDRYPLGFRLTLKDFRRDFNPGGIGAAAFASRVRLVDTTREIDEEREISMNSPLVNGKFTIYQSSFQEASHGKEASIFTAAHDPGRFMKYLGCLMICGGIFIMFYMRSYMFQKIPSLLGRKRKKPTAGTPAAAEEHPAIRRAA